MVSILKNFLKKIRNTFNSLLLSFPKLIQCNVCGWQGRHFLSDDWHKYIICPNCRSEVRHRLFFATFQHIERFSNNVLFRNKRILHFAPSDTISNILRQYSTTYFTADLYRKNFDFKIDITSMPEIEDNSFDAVLVFDVLEHVTDYNKALDEIYRIMSDDGYSVFTVPQKDNLQVTYEDPSIITPKDRELHFGQHDHLRIFGSDFEDILADAGFLVEMIDHLNFSNELQKYHVLSPPELSKHPLATNFRKVFFCRIK